MTDLSTSSLEKALARLDEALAMSREQPENDVIRDGVIQRFEYTMDLCWKLLQRYLMDVAQIGIEQIRTKRDLFREAARLKLLSSAEPWFVHYDARNRTSHVYDSAVAAEIFGRIPAFLQDARELLAELHIAIGRSI